ncbi:hypothetical protein [Corynebacterium sp. NML140438]|uniref:hypothetical protein n=1 Tax=Corynebacterium sp. NML140438 TaxID=1906334 RepID=UPI00210189F8|nr:hypothetical protein [Corynebacterium sp. NML140438]
MTVGELSLILSTTAILPVPASIIASTPLTVTSVFFSTTPSVAASWPTVTTV